MSRVAVLGAGLAGVCACFELTKRGFSVDLFERNSRPVCAASLVNEGKIHLGLVYANANSPKTVELLLDGALEFKSLLGRLVPESAFQYSAPFQYLVAADSLLPPSAINRHFQQVQEIYSQKMATADRFDYLGSRPEQLSGPFATSPKGDAFVPGKVAAFCQSSELALDTAQLALALERAVADCRDIRFFLNHEIEHVDRSESGLSVQGNAASGAWTRNYEQVVNALWDSRLMIDASAGVPLPEIWNYRVKMRVLCEPSDREEFRKSYTMLLGPYGDLVHFPDGPLYLSWYPACLKGWSNDLSPPESWKQLCDANRSWEDSKTLANDILQQASREWMPALETLKPIDVNGGIICGSGKLDIDHPDSGLHQRDEAGVFSEGGYHSINTGKYSLAPLLAAEAAKRVANFEELQVSLNI